MPASNRGGRSRDRGFGGRDRSRDRDSGRDQNNDRGRDIGGSLGFGGGGKTDFGGFSGGGNTRAGGATGGGLDFGSRDQQQRGRSGGGGGLAGRALEALTRNPLRPPTGDDPGILGTAVGLMAPGFGAIVGGGALLADWARDAGMDVRNPGRPGRNARAAQRDDGDERRLLAPVTPTDDVGEPQGRASTPKPPVPGDPSNLGRRGRRRRISDLSDSGASPRRLLSLD